MSSPMYRVSARRAEAPQARQASRPRMSNTIERAAANGFEARRFARQIEQRLRCTWAASITGKHETVFKQIVCDRLGST